MDSLLPRYLPLIVLLTASHAAEIDFVHEVVPVLKAHCTGCHGGKEAKGGFSMNTRDLFLEDDAAIPGDAAKSHFLELVHLTDPDDQMPPSKKDRVPAEQIAVLERWVDAGLPWEPGYTFGVPTYEPPLRPRRPDLPDITDGREHPVDRFIDAYVAEQKLPRPEPCDDATFLRRVSLDLIGMLPPSETVTAFLGNSDPDKRTKLVGDLLARDLDYADHWLTFWNDLLRNDYTGTGFITKGRTQISGWLYDALKNNMAYDSMIRDLIAPPDESSAGFINGIKWRGEVSAGQTLPIQFAQSISQSFLGINMKCASCHDSFVDRWKLSEAYGLAAIYAEEPLAVHRCDKPTGEMAKAAWLFPELGQVDGSAPKDQRLSQLAALMIHPENGRVARTLVNRLWGQLMGRGLVHPFDAMQTEPWLPDLLDWLAVDFQEHGYDLRHTILLIATSEAYRSASAVHEQENGSATYRYAGPEAKRLTAEQFVDALWTLTDTAPKKIDAPVTRGMVNPAEVARLSQPSQWIWGPSAASGPPAAGETIVLRRDFQAPVGSRGSVIASVDNEYVLYLNGQTLANGKDFAVLGNAAASGLKAGENRLLVVAKNGGSKPNLAGAFIRLLLSHPDGSEQIITTDATWQASSEVPVDDKVGKWPVDTMAWTSVVIVKAPEVWTKAIDPKIGKTLASVSATSDLMVRASLVNSDFLMRSLGRPHRDQIVSSRPRDLTTLEAIDLANQETLAQALVAGAERLQARGESPPGLIETMFLSTLSRRPTADERALLLEALGEAPEPADVADALWAVMMTPEFLLVR